MALSIVGTSSNGKTADSGSAYRGSNPCVPATPRQFWRYHQDMSWPDRIIIDPAVLAGKPVIRGTRLSVEFILDLLAAGESEAAILVNYPGVTRADVLACLAYASFLAHEYKTYPTPV